MVKHRICKKCGGRIKKVHRWHVVHHRFLFLRWETVEHRDCARPEMVHRHVVPLASVEDLRDFQQNQADILDTLKANLLESITPSKIAKASALQIATAYGIMYDKAALLRGQATGINVVALLDVVKAIKESELHRLPAARVVEDVPASYPPNSSDPA